MNPLRSLLIISVIGIFIQGAISYHATEEMMLAPDQLAKFTTFKTGAASLAIVNALMKKDNYMVKYFRDAEFDSDKATATLKSNLEWRVKNKIDTDQTADFSDIKGDFPTVTTSVDREGRPILFAPSGKYDMPKTFSAKKGDRLLQYIFYHFELMGNMAIQKPDQGKDVSRWIFLIDLHDYNGLSLTCYECLQLYKDMATHIDSKWPMLLEKTIYLNAPPMFKTVNDMTSPLLKKETRDNTVVMKSDGVQNKAYLLTLMTEDQIPAGVYFGESNLMTQGTASFGGAAEKYSGTAQNYGGFGK